MSDENLWGEEEFNDMPDEAQLDEHGRPKQSPQVNMPRPAQRVMPRPPPRPVQEEVIYEEAEVEKVEEVTLEDFTDVLADANLRIEQGRLYQMIMNHKLFEGLEADPRAVANVEREIKKFARESMEVMLGMRQTTPAHAQTSFNGLEIEILKKLAFAGSGGMTKSPEADRVAEQIKDSPKRNTLNAIGSPQKAPVKKPLQKQPQAPVKRSPKQNPTFVAEVDQLVIETGMPREAIEQALLEKNDTLNKAGYEMTTEELIERNRVAAQRRGTQVKSSKALPMPSYEQQEAAAMNMAGRASSSHLSKFIEAAKKMPPSK